MSYDLEDAWQEEAYDRMVEEILEHPSEIIGEFAKGRLLSDHADHPNLADQATHALQEARMLLSVVIPHRWCSLPAR